MQLSDIISIAITTATRTIARAGFGIPLILSASAPSWTERVRTYSTIDAVGNDFATTTPEYKAAARFFAQSPRVRQVKIGRAALPATQQFELTPLVANSYAYTFYVVKSGTLTAVTYTSDGSATAAEITGGLKTAFDLLGLAMTSSQQSGNTVLRLVANTAGTWFDLKSNDPNLPIVQNHADPGVATDLAAIKVEDDTWYALVTLMNSKAVIDAAASWCETAKKLYVAQTQDSACRDTALSGTDDVMESTKNSAYKHTSVWYSVQTSDFLDAGILGVVLPYDPGSWTAAFKEIAGVPAGAYTATQRTNITGKNGNFYEPTAGTNIAWEGKSAQGQFIDITQSVDWLEARLAESVFEKLINAPKIPYTAKGIAVIEGAVRQVLKQASLPPMEMIDPDFEVIVPNIADVPSADKTTRTLNNVEFNATLTGAIHKVNLQGTISV